MNVDDSDRTRLRTLQTIQAAITADIEDQVRKMIEVGFPPDSAYLSTRVWWSRMVVSAIREARKNLEDVL